MLHFDSIAWTLEETHVGMTMNKASEKSLWEREHGELVFMRQGPTKGPSSYLRNQAPDLPKPQKGISIGQNAAENWELVSWV